MQKKYHFFNLSFIYASENSPIQMASSIFCCRKRFISNMQISKAKKFAGIPETSILLSCSYLGKMTKEEWETAE
jgi:hypothetical protein